MSNDFHEAIKLFTEAIKNNPYDAMLYSFRANCQKRLKNYEESLKDSLKSIELNPKVHDLTYLRIIKCYLWYGDTEKAKEYIQESKIIFPRKQNLVDEQLVIIQQFEIIEVKAKEYFEKQENNLCLVQINQALEIAQECQRLKELKEKCLERLSTLKDTCPLDETDESDDNRSLNSVFSTTDMIRVSDKCFRMKSYDSFNESESGNDETKNRQKRLRQQESDNSTTDDEPLQKKIKKSDVLIADHFRRVATILSKDDQDGASKSEITKPEIEDDSVGQMGPPKPVSKLKESKVGKFKRLTRKRRYAEESKSSDDEDEEKPKKKPKKFTQIGKAFQRLVTFKK